MSSSGFDAPDLEAIPVLLALLVLALAASSLFVVWIAPALLAELLLDAVLAAGLYRRLRHIERRHWLETALRKTAWPFVLTAVVVPAWVLRCSRLSRTPNRSVTCWKYGHSSGGNVRPRSVTLAGGGSHGTRPGNRKV